MPLPALLESLGQVFAFLWTEVLCCNDQVRKMRLLCIPLCVPLTPCHI
jgi:hypothetical protein